MDAISWGLELFDLPTTTGRFPTFSYRNEVEAEVAQGTQRWVEVGTVIGGARLSGIKNNVSLPTDFVRQPQAIWGRSADNIASEFRAAGYDVNVRQSTRGSGSATIVEVKGHPQISQVQVHPGGGRHGGAYYKVSTTTDGTIKVVDPKTYKADPEEKARIISGG